MQVKDIMSRDIVSVTPDTDIHSVAELFITRDISGAPVVDAQGRLVGLVLEEGLILQDKKVHLPTLVYILNGVFAIGEDRFEEEMRKIAAITVSGIMEKQFTALSPETSVEDVATMMVEEGKHYFPVLEHGNLVGIVTKKDIVRAIAQRKIW